MRLNGAAVPGRILNICSNKRRDIRVQSLPAPPSEPSEHGLVLRASRPTHVPVSPIQIVATALPRTIRAPYQYPHIHHFTVRLTAAHCPLPPAHRVNLNNT